MVRAHLPFGLVLLAACFANSPTIEDGGEAGATGTGSNDGPTTLPSDDDDDADEAGDDDDTDPDTTGSAGAGCGNEVVDGDEDCDDANDDPSDGCHLCRASGTILWEAWNATPSNSDGVASLDIASDGSIYAAGAAGAGQGTDMWLRKYSPDGEAIWTRTPQASVGPIEELAFDVTVDEQDMVHVVGQAFDPLQAYNLVLVSYTPEGDVTQELVDDDQAAGDINGGTSVIMGPSGSLITSGYRSDVGPDTLAVVREHGGSEPRYETGSGPGEAFATGWEIASREGRIRVAFLLGNSVEVSGWDDGFSDKPDWTTPAPGSLDFTLSADELEPVPIVIEANGSTVACSNINAGSRDMQLTRFGAGGNVLDNVIVDFEGADDLCGDLVLVGDDLVLVSSADVGVDDGDIVITRISPAGRTVWQGALPSAAAGQPRGLAAAVGPDGLLVVGGSRNQRESDRDAYVAKVVP